MEFDNKSNDFTCSNNCHTFCRQLAQAFVSLTTFWSTVTENFDNSWLQSVNIFVVIKLDSPFIQSVLTTWVKRWLDISRITSLTLISTVGEATLLLCQRTAFSTESNIWVTFERFISPGLMAALWWSSKTHFFPKAKSRNSLNFAKIIYTNSTVYNVQLQHNWRLL